MSALVEATPPLKDAKLEGYDTSGLALKGVSYWRVQTALGRVLGSLSGVISLCGWIGPCPPVDTETRYIRLTARRVAPICCNDVNDDGFTSPDNASYGNLELKEGNAFENYAQEILDESKYTVPTAPTAGTPATFQRVILKKLPLEINIQDPIEAEWHAKYRASINFELKGATTIFTLFTNPVFVTPPPCEPGPNGLHKVHQREHFRFTRVIDIDKLKKFTHDERVLVSNATGAGAETLARAWCAENGKDALVRRQCGACFTCCVRAASKGLLGVGIVIWVS